MKAYWMIAALAFAPAPVSAAPAVDPLYRLAAATTLASTDTDWDYIKLEPDGTRLFIARRKDGLTVYDTQTRQVVGQVANSQGAKPVAPHAHGPRTRAAHDLARVVLQVVEA